MLKVKVTKKEILRHYKNVISAGYCNLQYLLNEKDSKFYTCGVYGWNSDIYEINDNTCICTGYRPFGNVKVDYDIQEKYDNEARAICCSDLQYEQKKKKVNKLLDEFIMEVLK